MEQRKTGGKADEWFFFFFEWDEREEHIEETKKGKQRMAGREAGREVEGANPSLVSRLESGLRRACRLR